jgi:hypothetical protein
VVAERSGADRVATLVAAIGGFVLTFRDYG